MMPPTLESLESLVSSQLLVPSVVSYPVISGSEGFAYRIFVPWIGFGAILFLPNLTCFATFSSNSTEGKRFSGFAGTGRAVEFPDPTAAVVSLLRRVYAQEVCGVRGWECPLFAARS